jgi:hypothetical protein
MAEIVQSLFGITPESYRATQQQQADAQALQYAKLDPFQQANFAIGRGATMLGGAIGGALGGQDPELQRITMRQQIARQLNPNDPASIEQGISALSQAGDSQGAMMLQAEYRKLVESRALVSQRDASALASTAQATRERTQASPKEVQLAREVAALTGFEPGTPQYNTAYAESLREQMAPKPTAEAKPNIQKLQEYAATLPAGSPLRAQVEAAIKAEGEGKGTRVNVGVKLPEQEKEEKGARGKLLVKQYEDVSNQAKVAVRTLPALESNLAILDKGFDTGFGTEVKAAGAKVLSALGVPDATQFATDAQTFLGSASAAVLQRQLEQKGPQTESDAQRITATGAQLGNTKDANKFLINVAKAQLKRDVEQRNFYDKWWKANNTYDGAEDAWFSGEGGKSLFDRPELKAYAPRATSAASQIPGQGATTIPQAAIDALKAGRGTDAQFDAMFGPGAAKRARGVK